MRMGNNRWMFVCQRVQSIIKIYRIRVWKWWRAKGAAATAATTAALASVVYVLLIWQCVYWNLFYWISSWISFDIICVRMCVLYWNPKKAYDTFLLEYLVQVCQMYRMLLFLLLLLLCTNLYHSFLKIYRWLCIQSVIRIYFKDRKPSKWLTFIYVVFIYLFILKSFNVPRSYMVLVIFYAMLLAYEPKTYNLLIAKK